MGKNISLILSATQVTKNMRSEIYVKYTYYQR